MTGSTSPSNAANKPGSSVSRRASSRAGASLPCAEFRTSGFQFPDAVSHRAIGQAGGLHDRRNAAPAQGSGFRGGPPPSSSLIQLVDERTILATNPFDNICIRHGRIIAQSRLSNQCQFR